MSILAEFVQLGSDELAALLRDPASVSPLFHAPQRGSFGALTPEVARARLERLSPLLSGAVQGLDPRLRQQLAEHLGRTTKALADPDTAGALFDMLRAHGLIRDAGSEAPEAVPGPRLSLDEAWHGVHFLLTGQAEPSGGAAPDAILGGHEIGDDDGYGPARYFTVGEVAVVAAELDREDLEGVLGARYAPERMMELGIYPGGWDEGAEQWLIDAFHDLRSYFRGAAEARRAVVTCLV